MWFVIGIIFYIFGMGIAHRLLVEGASETEKINYVGGYIIFSILWPIVLPWLGAYVLTDKIMREKTKVK